jgi:2-polyprenyl-6-methoxyphenol hydroxylase-like FAD-dependent oxidoreductase
MLVANKTLAIIGGGPGGLTLARLLQKHGADVKVYERDLNKHVRVQGATLDLHEESGLKAIKEAGLMEAFKAHYRPGADRVRVINKHAVIIADQHDEQLYDGRTFEETRPEIDRGPLRNILLESLQPETVVWNSHFKSLEPIDGGWNIEFQNGSFATADIVIGADGANSKIRPAITDIKPFLTGVTAIEGMVYESETNAPQIHHLLKGGKIFAFGDNKSLIVSAKGDGSLAFYLGLKTEENWHRKISVDFTDKAQVLRWFQKEFAGWDNVWYELFEQTSSPLMLRPQFCMPLDQTWEALPNVTILGDAAHLMPPYAGEGVNMAMLDALELSICLTQSNFTDMKTAIAYYEQQMRTRASKAAAMTLESMALLHSPDAIPFMTNIIKQFE